MRRRTYQHSIEILPAALWSRRQTWQAVRRSLPPGGCLLVTDPQNRPQTELMQALARLFRQKGRTVVVWAARRRRCRTAEWIAKEPTTDICCQ